MFQKFELVWFRVEAAYRIYGGIDGQITRSQSKTHRGVHDVESRHAGFHAGWIVVFSTLRQSPLHTRIHTEGLLVATGEARL